MKSVSHQGQGVLRSKASLGRSLESGSKQSHRQKAITSKSAQGKGCSQAIVERVYSLSWVVQEQVVFKGLNDIKEKRKL